MSWGGAPGFIPLLFQPGEAYQFDGSHEDVEIAGASVRVKAAHMRLCGSRAVYVRCYPRETQEMVFDAHADDPGGGSSSPGCGSPASRS